MAHAEKMKNVRLEVALVARAEKLKGVRCCDVGLKDSAGTWSYSYREPRYRFGSTTKVVGAALALGLAELEKRLAATDKERDAQARQIRLRMAGADGGGQ